MKNFTDILKEMQGGISAQLLKRGISIEITPEEAQKLFGEKTVWRTIGSLEFRLNWVVTASEKNEKVKLFVKSIPE